MVTQEYHAPITISRTITTGLEVETDILLAGEAVHLPPGGVTSFRMSVSVVTTGDITSVDSVGPFDFAARRYTGDDVGITGTDVSADVLTKTLSVGLTFRVRINENDGPHTGVVCSIQDAREVSGARTIVTRVTFERLSETVGATPVAKP
jgi:hypothetical protein